MSADDLHAAADGLGLSKPTALMILSMLSGPSKCLSMLRWQLYSGMAATGVQLKNTKTLLGGSTQVPLLLQSIYSVSNSSHEVGGISIADQVYVATV